MSFYGDIKRIPSSPYIFDRYYPNRAAMDDACTSDNVYIGRYVLVKYTCKYSKVEGEENKIEYFNKYSNVSYSRDLTVSEDTYRPNTYFITNGNNLYILCQDENFTSGMAYYVANKILSPDYVENVKADIERYQDTFNCTVWQKIYTNITGEDTKFEKYIMVAELNAAVPRLVLDVINPKHYQLSSLQEPITEEWYEPKILAEASSEDAYTFLMPNMLHFDVNNITSDFYARDLINPQYRYLMYENGISTDPSHSGGSGNILSRENMLSSLYNYMNWKNYLGSNEATEPNGDIDTKKLDMKLYAFGQLLSDLYDALYGVPSTGTGARPFYTDSLDDVLTENDKGLIGILSSIATDAKGNLTEDFYGRRMQPGMYYYFTSSWNDAEENPDSFIENIPEVIGSSDELTAGRSHYRLTFSPVSGETSYITKLSAS